MKRWNARRLTLCALFAALTAVCAQVIIPIGAVPVSLSLLPVLICAAVLSPADALIAMAVYLLLGLAGAPVFSNFEGGPAKLLGPTGGYLVGYLPCVLVTALLIRWLGRSAAGLAVSMGWGVVVCYALGTVWFMHAAGRDLGSALRVCVLPFLPFDAVKIALATLIALRTHKALAASGGARD